MRFSRATWRIRAVDDAADDIARGRPVVVVGDVWSECVAHLVQAAAASTPESMSFLVRHTSGFLRVPVAAEICEVLELPQMVRHNENAYGAAYTVSVDARSGVSTGISARDRCRTVRVLADASARPDDLTRPGHVVPVRSQPGGLLTRIGFAEAAVDLAVLAGQRPAAVMSELVGSRDEHVLPAIDEVASFAAEHRLAMISLSELVAHCGKARPLALEGMSG